MCIEIIFTCPGCNTPSGFKELQKCDEEAFPCRGREFVHRFNKPQHFKNWFCSDDECPYSQLFKAVEALELQDMHKRQSMGYIKAKPEVPKRRRKKDGPMITHVGSEPEYRDLVYDSDMDEPEPSPHNGTSPPPGVNTQTGHDNGSGFPETPSDKLTTPEIKAKKLQKKKGVDLGTLDFKVQHRIRDLRAQVKQLGTPKRKKLWWMDCETHLLAFCAVNKLPMFQIASFLPRHSRAACEKRLEALCNMDYWLSGRMLEKKTKTGKTGKAGKTDKSGKSGKRGFRCSRGEPY
ncbi:hypothetical protein V8F20_003626 [Naviculisporaceae sp. PSN 640]